MAFEIAPPRRDVPRASARRNERDAIWRLCGWGGAAIVAVLALTAATQSDTGGERLAQMFSPPPAVAQAAPGPLEKDPETLRLQADLRALAADRERLAVRLARLESHLEEVTGSIQRQVSAAAAARPPAAAPSPPPQIAAAHVTPAAQPEPPAAPARAAAVTPPLNVPIIDPLAMPLVASSTGWTVRPPDDEPLQAQSFETRDVPLPPPRLAALPAPAPEQAGEPARPPSPAKSEYGIDLGVAPDMDALRDRWSSIKANLGPMLTGLQPIAVRDRRAGNTNVHLVVGPMPNIAAARQVCARFAAAHVTCQPTKFDGEAVVQR